MMDDFWKLSDAKKRTVLLLEALGLVHDLGKLSDTFLRSQEPSSSITYNHNLLADPRRIALYQHYSSVPGLGATSLVEEWLADASDKACAFAERSDLSTILDAVKITDWTGQIYSFAELTPLVAKPGLAWGRHPVPPADWQRVLGKEMLPGLLIGMLHGVAHIEKEGNPNQNKQIYPDVFRASPFGMEERLGVHECTTALATLPLAEIEQIASPARQTLLKKMQTGMRHGLADSRRPLNEVSLWDWGYITAALVKAAAVFIYKQRWPVSLADLPFRTLRINLNRIERYTHSDKISDVIGLRDALDSAFEQVKMLLEETYALGNCLYHDETGAYYLFPDLNQSAEEEAALRRAIQEQFPVDLQPRVHFGERVTAGDLDRDKRSARKLVAEPRLKALQESNVQSDINLNPFETEWNVMQRPAADICTVCGVRPVGYPWRDSAGKSELQLAHWATQAKAEKRHVCRICLDRRGRRAQKWAREGLSGTIWTDEVADEHGRLALMVGKLGLEGWLDGTLLETLLVDGGITKVASPARLYRIAEIARWFSERVSGILTPDVVGHRPFRLALYPANASSLNLGDYHTYELNVDGLALGVVWDKPNGRFITIENLGYFAKRWSRSADDLLTKIQGRTLEIFEPSEYQSMSEVISHARIERVETMNAYSPEITLLVEPSVFMLLVPADKALALARAVKEEYERQLGRVRDRLPLDLGLVFFQRRTPIRAVLEAGRSMLEMSGSFNFETGAGWEGWRLLHRDLSLAGVCQLTFDNGILWNIPVMAGDSKVKDEWYPRLYQGDTWGKKRVIHARELSPRDPRTPSERGKRIWIRPSHFDFEFLDTTARRFEITYDESGRRPRRTRPFYLEDLDRLETLWAYLKDGLTSAQRHQVIRTIEATREAWYGQDYDGKSATDEVFQRFVADTLAGATWRQGHSWRNIPIEWQEKLIHAGTVGELADLAELHMEILKE